MKIETALNYDIVKQSTIRSPLTSIVMPAYNQPNEILRRGVISAITQETSFPYTVVIVDDGSRFPVKDALDTLLYDSRITLVREENSGISRSLNLAGLLASSQYLLRLDPDDELTPDAVGEFTRLFQSHEKLVQAYSDGYWIGSLPQEPWDWEEYSGADPSKMVNPWIKPEFSADLLLNNMFIGHARCCRKDTFLAVGGYSTEYQFAEDWDFALKLSEVGETRRLPKKLHKYYLLETGATCKTSVEKQSDTRKKILTNTLRRRGIALTEIPGDLRDKLDPDYVWAS